MHWLERTELLLGEEKLAKLKNANVLVVGLGGVGAYAAEQLCRAGIGKMTIVDGDVVEESNRNRQLPALISTKGLPKAEILAKRFYDINPDLELIVVNDFIRDEKTIELLQSQPFDYVVDAIDTLSPKVFLVYHAVQLGLNVVSSMGAGGKMDPSKIEITDIKKSYNCKLAKMMRKRLGRLGLKKGVKVVFSSEEIDESAVRLEEGQNKKSTVGTISYMPPLFGCFIASAVIRDLTT
ncbi:tRNA threonylcarbamoyladenosine dehydratase [Draconibacterium sp. IB214405]|uniref:tRNA threonylcarbamoyladenosine dehydratase n=1 Tax=Draconibacterium sp. IB214405 TaxID=3097352 RepID=UPI002A11B8C4|nr:tRNA threonylcarbamoyladenosine dehydratase [Draconibacterium sp. IB214405]MDX8339727.1 tRNA threonylcarbamoyladenosine dehydratase [Draconibacterium sp. IB214405]